MQKLIRGVERFKSEAFGKRRELFKQLATAQSPKTLFITCSDSRISPNLLTQTEPGEIFILRNAGNIVPAHGASTGGEAATVEYALSVLQVEEIVVCGHTDCGAMKGMLAPENLKELPAVREWLAHAEPTRQIVRENYAHLEGDARVNVAVQENVLAQLANLRTHPSVAARVASGKLILHGWVYKIGTGDVFAYDSTDGQFKPIQHVKEQVVVRRDLAILEI